METINKISEPSILTANTYFWNSGSSASNRRNNEKRKTDEVFSFLKSLGFEDIDSNNTCVHMKKENIEVVFDYSESSKNVYKHLSITVNGKNSNIKSLRKLYS